MLNNKLSTDKEIAAPKQEVPLFVGSSWARCQQLVEHLCQYSEQHIVVLGEQGCGKTTLAQSIFNSSNEIFQSAYIDSQILHSKEGILDSIKEQFDLNNNFDITGNIKNNKTWILCIDNAEYLDNDNLNMLLKVCRPRNDAGQLRLVLIANAAFENKINSKDITLTEIGNIHYIHIEPLTLPELETFIKFIWLRENDKSIPYPFTPRVIKKLFKLSQGNFTLSINLAKQYATTGEMQLKPKLDPKNLNYSSLKKISAVIIFLLSLTTILYLIFTSKKTFTPKNEITITSNTTPFMSFPEQKKTVTEVLDDYNNKQETLSREQTITEQPLMPQNNTDLNDELLVANVIENKVQSEQEVVDTLVIQEEPKLTSKKLELNIKPTTKEVIFYNMEGKTIPKPKKNFTLQLLGNSNETKMHEFMINNKLHKSFYYKTTRQNKAWFVLLYGDYATKELAMKDLEKTNLKNLKLKPIIQPLTPIRKNATK